MALRSLALLSATAVAVAMPLFDGLLLRDDPCDICNTGVCAPCKPCANIKTGPCAPCWAVDPNSKKSCLPDCEQCWKTDNEAVEVIAPEPVEIVAPVALIINDDPCDICNTGECAPCKPCVNSKGGPCAPCWAVDPTSKKSCLPACEQCWKTESATPVQAFLSKDFLSAIAATTHYGDPKAGCESDELAIQVQGVAGDFCAPKCSGSSCPSDVPSGVTAKAQCALQTPTGDKYCALICDPSGDNQCGDATCKSIQGVGLCTYDD